MILRSKGGDLVKDLFQYDLEIGGGNIKEVQNADLNKWGGKVKISKLFKEKNDFSLDPFVQWDSYFYSNGTRWIKPSVGLNAGKIITRDLSFELGYQHFVAIRGTSPFLYELYRYRPADTLSGKVKFKIGETNANISSTYFLDNWSPEDIDYSLFFKLHCYNLGLTYRSMRGDITFGVSLASQE